MESLKMGKIWEGPPPNEAIAHAMSGNLTISESTATVLPEYAPATPDLRTLVEVYLEVVATVSAHDRAEERFTVIGRGARAFEPSIHVVEKR